MSLTEEIVAAVKVLHEHKQATGKAKAHAKIASQRASAEAEILLDSLKEIGVDVSTPEGLVVLKILIASRISKAETGPVSPFGASGGKDDW